MMVGVSHRYRLEPALGQVEKLVRHCAGALTIDGIVVDVSSFAGCRGV